MEYEDFLNSFFHIQGNSVFKPQVPAKISIQAYEDASSCNLLKGVYHVRDIEATPRLVKGVYNVSEFEAAATSTMHEHTKFVKGIFNDIEAATKTAEGFDTAAKQCEVESFGSFASISNVFYQGLI